MEVTNDGSDTPDEVVNGNEPLSSSDPLPSSPKPSISKLSFHTSLETMPKRERFLKEQRKSETNFNKQPTLVIVDNEDLIRKSISSPTTLSLISNPAHDGKPEVEENAKQNLQRSTDSPLQKLGKFFRKRGNFSEHDPNNISMLSLDQFVQHRENRRMRKSKEQLHVSVIPSPTPQTQTLIELVRSKWEKSADKLPIHSDLPRLLKHIEIINCEGETIMTKHDTKKPYVVSKKILRNFLETLAIELGDTRDILPNIIQHFGHSSPYEEDDEDADLSVEVRLFIQSYMKEESSTLRVLKAITQTIIAAPFVELKQQFAEIGCEFVDVSGTWGIKVNIGPGDGSVTDKVIIVHTKGGRSATDQGFEFVWELALQFDRNMRDMEGLSLTITEITFASDYPKDKKKDIQKLITRWTSPSRRSTIRRSRTSLDPTPRIETASEKKTVKELLGSNATLQFMQWGTVTMNSKTKERLFVLSNYRVLLINKSQLFGQKKKIYEGHLFNLLGLSILEADKIKMKFIDSTFEFTSNGISVAVDIILNSYRKIQYCLPIIRPPIEISPLRHPSDAIITKKGVISIEEAGNRVIDSYVAYCEYYKTPIRKQIIAYLTSLISSGNRHLRLDAIPDSDPLDLEPVAAALKYDTFFDMLTLSNIPRREAILKLSVTVEHSKTLTHLVLSGLDTEDGFIELGNAIKRNVACRLVSIDLSNNTIRDKSMCELAHGIASLKFLRILRLSHCNIGANGMVDLMKEFATNKLLYETLEELDISGNPIGTIGSGGICSWISLHNKSLQMLKTVRLVTLNLSNCSCDLYSIFDNLRKSPFRYSIENIDVSLNKLDAITFEAICKFNNSSVALKNLRMISCGVTSKQCKLVLQSISNNHLLQSVTIDLSHNNLGTEVGGPISACLLISKNISGLVLRSNDIKKEGLTQLIHAAAINGCVQLLDISHNKCGVNSKVIQALSDLIAESKLETLNLSGLALGPELGTIFTSLASNTTLKHLDITKNHCGDSSAHFLFEALKVNKSLTSLRYDSNNITLEGWKSLRDCMKYNKTLSVCPLPQKDIRASVSLIYSRDRNTIQNSIATLMSEIQQSLKLNQLAKSPYRSVGVTRSYSNICSSSYRLSVADVCWFSMWDDCNGNLLPYLESSFRVKSGEDVGKALQVTHEQAKSIMGDVTTISVAVVALHKNKAGNRVINLAIAGPVKIMMWGIDGVFMDIDGKDTILGKEKVANVELTGGCSHVIMGSKVFWESIDDESVIEVMKTMHHNSEQASNKLHKTVLERGVKEHFTVSVIAV